MQRNDVWAEDPQPQNFHIKNSFQGLIHFSVELREIASFFWLVFTEDMTDDQPDLSNRSPPSRVWADIVCVRAKLNNSRLSGISIGYNID